MKIKNVKFSYVDGKYGIGPYVEWCAQLTVVNTNYNQVIMHFKKNIQSLRTSKFLVFHNNTDIRIHFLPPNGQFILL